jgi:hypothetical protein
MAWAASRVSLWSPMMSITPKHLVSLVNKLNIAYLLFHVFIRVYCRKELWCDIKLVERVPVPSWTNGNYKTCLKVTNQKKRCNINTLSTVLRNGKPLCSWQVSVAQSERERCAWTCHSKLLLRKCLNVLYRPANMLNIAHRISTIFWTLYGCQQLPEHFVQYPTKFLKILH